MITTIGYIIAFFTRDLVLLERSNCTAIRSRDLSRLPEASPAATIFTIRSGNTLGCSAMALARVSPFSALIRTSLMAFCSFLFSVASVSIRRASNIVTPARIMLTNWRQNTLRSLALGLPPISMLRSLVSRLCSFKLIMVMPWLFRSDRAFSILSASILPLTGFPAASIASYP